MTRFTIVLLPFLLVASRAAAQLLDSTAVVRINEATQARVRLHMGARGIVQEPRATTSGLAYDHGMFRAAGGTPVEAAQPMPLSEIRAIDVASGTLAGRGAAIGAGVGAGLGLLWTLTTAANDFVAEDEEMVLLAGVFYAAIGAGVGALIGKQYPRWHPVYRSVTP